jgi:hypothetical protein
MMIIIIIIMFTFLSYTSYLASNVWLYGTSI